MNERSAYIGGVTWFGTLERLRKDLDDLEARGREWGYTRFEVVLDDDTLDVFGYRTETEKEQEARRLAEEVRDRAELERLKAKLGE